MSANCHPFGFAEPRRDQRQAADVLDRQPLVTVSNSRGTNATLTPSSSQRRTSRSSTSWGAGEKVTITCSTSWLGNYLVEVPAGAQHRNGDATVPGVERLLVEEADRLEPELGVRQQALREQAPDAPAPTISVGRMDSP